MKRPSPICHACGYHQGSCTCDPCQVCKVIGQHVSCDGCLDYYCDEHIVELGGDWRCRRCIEIDEEIAQEIKQESRVEMSE